jgi:hypothetical protein
MELDARHWVDDWVHCRLQVVDQFLHVLASVGVISAYTSMQDHPLVAGLDRQSSKSGTDSALGGLERLQRTPFSYSIRGP